MSRREVELTGAGGRRAEPPVPVSPWLSSRRSCALCRPCG